MTDVPAVPAKPKAPRKPRKASKAKKGGKPHGPNLLIVESPAKAKTINKFIGSKYIVKACMGHVRDLPQHRMGVDLENDFAPHYITVRGKGALLKELKRDAAKAEIVYLAADPDREGEAICWHLKEALRLPPEKVRRAIFNEITKKVVKDAVDNATVDIDLKLVEAQQARRVLDRLVGYSLSPLLWTKVRKGLSAGRVQSVAVRLICDREAEVLAFLPVEYWTVDAQLALKGGRPFAAKLQQIDGAKIDLKTGDETRAAVARIQGVPFTVKDIERREQKRSPAPPFITSTLQQEAAKRYRFTAKRTMMIAQTLYEGVDLGAGTREGLITYMRTDSVRVSAEAQAEAREVLARLHGSAIVPEVPPVYKGRSSAQDAHEAIRPSHATREPEAVKSFLTPDQYKLYRLIWQRFLASQSNPAILEQTGVEIGAGPGIFRATGVVVKAPGFMALYKEAKEEDAPEDAEPEGALPAGLEVGQTLDVVEIVPHQHFTQPPPRFTDASLVKALEEDGIGRPSTYAPIIGTIMDRTYVERREGRFHPTELGLLVNGLLVQHFADIINVAFTASMEEQLDEVAEGRLPWIQALRTFHAPFAIDMEKAKVEMRNVKAEIEVVTDLVCEKCGKPMIVRWGRHGKFLACSGYPECRNAKSYETDAAGRIFVPDPVVTDEKCDKCGSPMIIRSGRFGKFMACQKYPECRTTRSIPLDFNCPKPGCEGKLVQRRSRKGRSFIGCNRYPECDFVTWNAPVKEACPKCGAAFLTERKLKGLRRLSCIVEGCGYEREEAAGVGAETTGSPVLSAPAPGGLAPAHIVPPEPPAGAGGTGVSG
ncbi:MAG: type I DNA topoisomerase [Candidatus Coatesbacteria bacterium]